MEIAGIHSYPKLRCPRGLRSRILLSRGIVFEGCGFGAPGLRVGEIVFTTGMVGYPESLTDPSYRGQILVITHPLVGNYGVPSRDRGMHGLPLHYESDRIQVEALVVAEETRPSHWESVESLHEWLRREGVPGISRVDTRLLVSMIREKGVEMAAVAVFPEDQDLGLEPLIKALEEHPGYDSVDYVAQVSPARPVEHWPEGGEARSTLVLYDCGVKYGILRELLNRGFHVVRIPCGWSLDKALSYDPSGIVLSNGPGNPLLLQRMVETAASIVEQGIPVLGICLGHQLLALALGARIHKMKYGHRGHNKPVRNLETGACYVSSQNHGYAVSLEAAGLKPWFVNPDDRTLEGFKAPGKPLVAVQFHPEASPGPWDLAWVFDIYARMVERHA